eukprot:jgi/Mesen1/2694/ME000167S01841
MKALFCEPDGTRQTFFMPARKEDPVYEDERDRLKRLIEVYGGIWSNFRCADGKTVYELVEDVHDVSHDAALRGQVFLLSKYVDKCVEYSRPLSKDTYVVKKKRPYHRFTLEHDGEIERHVAAALEQDPEVSLKGNTFWQEAEVSLGIGHPWSSIKDRYMKHLRPEIEARAEQNRGEPAGAVRRGAAPGSGGGGRQLPAAMRPPAGQLREEAGEGGTSSSGEGQASEGAPQDDSWQPARAAEVGGDRRGSDGLSGGEAAAAAASRDPRARKRQAARSPALETQPQFDTRPRYRAADAEQAGPPAGRRRDVARGAGGQRGGSRELAGAAGGAGPSPRGRQKQALHVDLHFDGDVRVSVRGDGAPGVDSEEGGGGVVDAMQEAAAAGVAAAGGIVRAALAHQGSDGTGEGREGAVQGGAAGGGGAHASETRGGSGGAGGGDRVEPSRRQRAEVPARSALGGGSDHGDGVPEHAGDERGGHSSGEEGGREQGPSPLPRREGGHVTRRRRKVRTCGAFAIVEERPGSEGEDGLENPREAKRSRSGPGEVPAGSDAEAEQERAGPRGQEHSPAGAELAGLQPRQLQRLQEVVTAVALLMDMTGASWEEVMKALEDTSSDYPATVALLRASKSTAGVRADALRPWSLREDRVLLAHFRGDRGGNLRLPTDKIVAVRGQRSVDLRLQFLTTGIREPSL